MTKLMIFASFMFVVWGGFYTLVPHLVSQDHLVGALAICVVATLIYAWIYVVNIAE